ncbi:ATP-dependent sacrificial sulfur transferase LarE [Anaerocolumna sp. AGMB13025]|uniref:ATP-dependent sacrificial sulfur transferase LarE n=1 Tax=Anaerocolumna sp. AGMB13025 TaxID=3039116 RepID=UPI00241C2534|nr:ATP-dependent sacrificial sulfur transferase LarE [Anaerocolumna sp. AGMB13025]WFR56247.1 ATP-dependent sacrificial sulfur transferase LarE [Anaerocolumna sp. AGMB13025]
MEYNFTSDINQFNYQKLAKVMETNSNSGICVAFSGGVDSSLLLKIACDTAKEKNQSVLAVTFETRLHPHGDLDEAKELALSFGANHKVIAVDEFSDPEIMHNPIDRCYRCKNLLFKTLIQTAQKEDYHYLMDGSNYDDLDAYRPGMKALKELGIHSPLLELKITKSEIRSLASDLFILSSNRPSAPCLATRLPYGDTLDFDLLERIDLGEKYIKKLGFYNVRLRAHKDILRIEVDKEAFPKFMESYGTVVQQLKELGFLYITLDLEGFRSGSMDIKIT